MRPHAPSTAMFQAAVMQAPMVVRGWSVHACHVRCTRCAANLPCRTRRTVCCDWMSGVFLVVVLSLPGGETEMTGKHRAKCPRCCDGRVGDREFSWTSGYHARLMKTLRMLLGYLMIWFALLHMSSWHASEAEKQEGNTANVILDTDIKVPRFEHRAILLLFLSEYLEMLIVKINPLILAPCSHTQICIY
jgi:hypothetical protein